MTVLDEVLRATAVAATEVGCQVDPEQLLFTATLDVIDAIVEGHGVTTVDRLAAVAQIVSADPGLTRQVSAARERILGPAIAEHMGSDIADPAVRRMMTNWSAIVSAAYSLTAGTDSVGTPRTDDELAQRMIARLAASFFRVMLWQQRGH